jgi:chromosome partitioning protein
MKLLTITGYKGGVGKSTVAINLAVYLGQKAQCLLVDGDPNRTALSLASRGEGSAGSFPIKVVDERQAMKIVSDFDFVVIDTPARPHSDDLKELAKGCDLLILPTVPDILSLEPMLETAAQLGKEAKYQALLTMVPPLPSKEGAIMQEELRDNGIPVFSSMIRRSAGFSKAALAGVSIRDLKDSRAKVAWNDFKKLGAEVLEVLP